MRINVHAGHNPDGKIACGAIGFIQESTEARKVKNEVISQLKQLGHVVYDCTCENGTSQSNVLNKIVNACNSHSVDLDISIHFNAGVENSNSDGKTTGTEVFTYGTSDIAKTYAERVCDAISKLGYKNRGVKVNKKLYFLRKTKAPAILIECCFVDDKDDVQLYDYQKIAEAIVYGVTYQKIQQKEEPLNEKEETEKIETIIGDKKCIYRVQVGAYGLKSNAENMKEKLKNAGFDAIVVKA